MIDVISIFFCGVIILYIGCFVSKLIDDLESAFPKIKVSARKNAVYLLSAENFYCDLFDFIFESNKLELLSFRQDLSQLLRLPVFEKHVRTNNPNLFRNITLKLNSANDLNTGYKVLKCSSLLNVQSLNQMEKALLCRSEIIRLQRMGMKIISNRLIFESTILEIVAIDDNLSEHINDVTNRINEYNP